uniref:Uncharacterized protein n=1 Tax=Panagrolaimus sp. ES5 TaxID=591445 RepID=A0AC34GFF7_9BILA
MEIVVLPLLDNVQMVAIIWAVHVEQHKTVKINMVLILLVLMDIVVLVQQALHNVPMVAHILAPLVLLT